MSNRQKMNTYRTEATRDREWNRDFIYFKDNPFEHFVIIENAIIEWQYE